MARSSYISKKGMKVESRKLRKQARQVGYADPRDSKFLKIAYVRYADDFLVGVSGPRILAERIRKLLFLFLKKLKLELNMDKTLISRAKGNHIPFLGYLISYGPKTMMPKGQRYQGKWRTIKRFREGHIRLLVNMKKVIEKLSNKGYCDSFGNPKPNFHYLQDPQSYTVSRAASVLRGMANYYHLAESKRRCVSRISYIIQHSLAKMFAAKYKLRTRAKVFKLGGKDLSKPLKTKKGNAPVGVTDKNIQEWAETAGGSIKDDFPGLPYAYRRQIPAPDV